MPAHGRHGAPLVVARTVTAPGAEELCVVCRHQLHRAPEYRGPSPVSDHGIAPYLMYDCVDVYRGTVVPSMRLGAIDVKGEAIAGLPDPEFCC